MTSIKRTASLACVLTASLATVTVALCLTACGSGRDNRAAADPVTSSAPNAITASSTRPSPISTFGIRTGDLPSTFVRSDSEPLVTPAFDARVRRCLSQPAAPRAVETHQSGWNRDRRRHESAVLTTTLRYADQGSATRYTGLAHVTGAAGCFDKVLTTGFQAGDKSIRITPHSAAVRGRTSDEPKNVAAVVTYHLRTAPPEGIDASYGQVDIYYLASPLLGAAFTNFAFNEAPDKAVRAAALDRFAARVARG